jgi:hypothetical protein
MGSKREATSETHLGFYPLAGDAVGDLRVLEVWRTMALIGGRFLVPFQGFF